MRLRRERGEARLARLSGDRDTNLKAGAASLPVEGGMTETIGAGLAAIEAEDCWYLAGHHTVCEIGEIGGSGGKRNSDGYRSPLGC